MNDVREQSNAVLTAAWPARQTGGDGVSVDQHATGVASTSTEVRWSRPAWWRLRL